uniref:Uncharacterized protein n=1 Tax=Oryza sativa subsp. japonica TaxID=39947 RepID=Q6EUI3_ORYSJ|nr:hypothetical protein [Oryza sativa Japonica Group]
MAPHIIVTPPLLPPLSPSLPSPPSRRHGATGRSGGGGRRRGRRAVGRASAARALGLRSRRRRGGARGGDRGRGAARLRRARARASAVPGAARLPTRSRGGSRCTGATLSLLRSSTPCAMATSWLTRSTFADLTNEEFRAKMLGFRPHVAIPHSNAWREQ